MKKGGGIMRIYATSDWHGFYGLYPLTKRMLEPDDVVLYLGDATDRGPKGWTLLKALLDDPQFIYLKGNHDDMLIHRYFDRDWQYWERLHDRNGGYTTIEDMKGESTETIHKYLRRLEKAPTYSKQLVNGKMIFLSHSGSTCIDDEEKLLWDRRHFFSKPEAGIDLVIHGHTPIPYLIEDLGEAGFNVPVDTEEIPVAGFKYQDGTKIDLDCATILTGTAVLFDIETLESYPLYISEEEERYLW